MGGRAERTTDHASIRPPILTPDLRAYPCDELSGWAVGGGGWAGSRGARGPGNASPLPPRLLETGGARRDDRISHRIPLASLAEIDAELRQLLRLAYDLDA
ncbi:MAG: hypothetical protein V1750_04655 [Acidobacteriota bacterium]